MIGASFSKAAALRHHRKVKEAAVVAEVVEATAMEPLPNGRGSETGRGSIEHAGPGEPVRPRGGIPQGRISGSTLVAAFGAAYVAALVLGLFFGIRRELS